MEAFVLHTGFAVPLDRANVDTDQIIPKQYLKSIKRTGFGDYLFDSWRFLDSGEIGMTPNERRINRDFVLNEAKYQGASILLARECRALHPGSQAEVCRRTRTTIGRRWARVGAWRSSRPTWSLDSQTSPFGPKPQATKRFWLSTAYPGAHPHRAAGRDRHVELVARPRLGGAAPAAARPEAQAVL